MSKYLVIAIAGLFLTFHTYAQRVKGSVKGIVVDTSGKQTPLSSATVSLTPRVDTTNQTFVTTDKRGAFAFNNLRPGNYRLLITFEGYTHVSQDIVISAAHADYDLGTLYMQRREDLLPDVVIQSPPMKIKDDTVEYKADLFAVKPQAFVEDQLKKLPGVEVDASGNITAQGETVTRVLVNGKRFFNDDPKLATRNIPPDIVDKYQVFDDLDDQSKFTGIDDGNRVKTLNIITKKDKSVGYFGRAIAGIGTNEAYDGSFNFHRFNNDQQISALGEANDINKQNFTIQDILGSSGGRRGSGGGPAAATNQSSSGITTVWAGGVNYHDDWGAKSEVYGSYFYNYNHVALDQSSLAEKFINEDSTNTTNSNSSSFGRTSNQRVYLNLEQKLDSSNSFIFRPNVTFETAKPNGSSNSTTMDNHDSLVSTTNGYSSSTNNGFNINGSNFTFRHKFKHPYQTLTLDLTGTVNVNDGDGYTYSNDQFYKLGTSQIINQYYNDSLHSYSISPTLNYTQAVSKHSYILLSYAYSYNKSVTTNNTYDFNDSTQTYTNFDSLFSNSYRFTSNSNRVALTYRIQHSKLNFNIGSGVQFMDFNSLNTTKDIDVTHSYVNLTPTVQFNYSFNSNRRLRIYYMGRTGSPSASQLQPLVTTSDDINFTVGNPDLKPQFTHSLRALYQSYNPVSGTNIFATLNASTTVNDIQNENILTSKGGDTSKYVNLNGTYNVAGYFNYGFPINIPKSNLNFTTNVNYSQSQNLLQDSTQPVQHDFTYSTAFTEKVYWTTNIKNNFDMNFSSASTYTINRNTLTSASNLNAFSQVFNVEVTAYTNSGWLAAATLTYTIANNKTQGYNESVPLLTPSIAKELMKKKAEIKLTMFDALHQNTSVSKSVTGYTSTATRTSVLQQYIMLTFTYNLNNFKGSQHNNRMPGQFPGGRRGGGGGNGGGGRRGGGGGFGGGGGGGDL